MQLRPDERAKKLASPNAYDAIARTALTGDHGVGGTVQDDALSRNGPEETGVAQGEHPAVGSHQPVAATVGVPAMATMGAFRCFPVMDPS